MSSNGDGSGSGGLAVRTGFFDLQKPQSKPEPPEKFLCIRFETPLAGTQDAVTILVSIKLLQIPQAESDSIYTSLLWDPKNSVSEGGGAAGGPCAFHDA